MIAAQYLVAGAPWRTLAIFANKSFFPNDGEYVVTVKVSI